METIRSTWCAIELNDPRSMDAPAVLFSPEVRLVRNSEDGPYVEIAEGNAMREILIENLVERPRGLQAKTRPNGLLLTVRDIEPTDSMLSELFPGRTLAMPVDAIMASLEGAEMPEPLQALVDDDGDVATLLLDARNGMYVRFNSTWHWVPPGQDPDPLDGYSVVDVDDEAVELFDSLDQASKQQSVLAYPVKSYEDVTPFQVIVDRSMTTLPTDAIAAGGAVIVDDISTTLPLIASSADIPTALSAAVRDPSIRWYVERRIAALGCADEYELPWKV